jgi:hypothetical protein
MFSKTKNIISYSFPILFSTPLIHIFYNNTKFTKIKNDPLSFEERMHHLMNY